ncbi:diphenol oxidase-A2 [Auriculariales sp. MPI-PUGE-AT-0066]|nr:diphenol oxidase-A2 [Auriculariales sp. MPI-PUGE-AT-0066]
MAPEADAMKVDTEAKTEPETKPAPVPLTAQQLVTANIGLVERSVSLLEPRFTHRALRTHAGLRKKLDSGVLAQIVRTTFAKDASTRAHLLSKVPNPPPAPDAESMDIDSGASKASDTATVLPETEAYIRLLILDHLIDTKSSDLAIALADETVARLQQLNRRSMDTMAAHVWFSLGRAYELAGRLDDARPLLLAAQRTAALRHDDESLAVLLNLLLRSYLASDLYSQADKLISKTTFPETASSAQLARHAYYLGRIRAVQLDYTDAHAKLQQALRRAPSAATAPGFFQAVHKLAITVELLMGDIPERAIFRHPVLATALLPYLAIARAVRSGSLESFQSTLATHAVAFAQDKTYTLVLRLRQNVIKTGIRRLSLSYARIGLGDICRKLHLDSEEDAEYIVGKAIRDGVIDGRVVHEKGWLECAGNKGAYGPEVSEVFNRRIAFCLGLHNESVKAMRYPLNAHRKELAGAEAAREREKELAKEIVDGEHDGDDDLGDF